MINKTAKAQQGNITLLMVGVIIITLSLLTYLFLNIRSSSSPQPSPSPITNQTSAKQEQINNLITTPGYQDVKKKYNLSDEQLKTLGGISLNESHK